MTAMRRTVAMVMAGGKGSRLGPLTCHRSKPAVPIGGRYRIIDFVLSNFINSDYRRIYVLTQYMASSLIKHLSRNWPLAGFGEFIEVVPAQMRLGDFWYRGTADAVFQNLNLLREARADDVAVFGGDHVYKFAIDQMEDYHHEKEADLTVAAFPVPCSEGNQFGIIHVDEDWRITGFLEKPADPPPIPGRPGWCLASMGNYFFDLAKLESTLYIDSQTSSSSHDFGRDIIPRLVAERARVFAYDFNRNEIPGEPPGAEPYWRDVGTVDSYFSANMDLRSRLPALNAYNRLWRIRTAQRHYPPARFVRPNADARDVEIRDSMVCEGSIVSSAVLRESLLGYDCFVHPNAKIDRSIVMSGCEIGANSELKNVLLDKNCTIEPGTTVGINAKEDAERFPFMTGTGTIVIPKGTIVPARGPIQIAYDMEALMLNDPDLKGLLQKFAGRYTVSEIDRNSAASAGPQPLRHGPHMTAQS